MAEPSRSGVPSRARIDCDTSISSSTSSPGRTPSRAGVMRSGPASAIDDQHEGDRPARAWQPAQADAPGRRHGVEPGQRGHRRPRRGPDAAQQPQQRRPGEQHQPARVGERDDVERATPAGSRRPRLRRPLARGGGAHRLHDAAGLAQRRGVPMRRRHDVAEAHGIDRGQRHAQPGGEPPAVGADAREVVGEIGRRQGRGVAGGDAADAQAQDLGGARVGGARLVGRPRRRVAQPGQLAAAAAGRRRAAGGAAACAATTRPAGPRRRRRPATGCRRSARCAATATPAADPAGRRSAAAACRR